MMQSEQEGQRNLQQSGAAGQRNKSGACAGKKQEECEESKEYLWQQ